MHRRALVNRALHRRRTGCLNAIHLDIRTQRLYGECNARDEAAAADRHHHSFYVGKLFEYFQADCALTGNHKFIVKRMDKRVAMLLLQLDGLGIGIVIDTGDQAHLGTVAFGGLHL